MEAEDAELYLSAASVWEMAIKASLGRLRLPAPVDVYIAEKMREGYRMTPLTWMQAAAVQQLPFHHRDPFDRLLAAQALVEGIPLVTGDPSFSPYGVGVLW